VPADDALWSAVSDPSRRRVLDLLITNGAVSASWLAGRISSSRQAVAKHLAALEHRPWPGRRRS
jgi:DNA-binding transcriptional ArsR family regulator